MLSPDGTKIIQTTDWVTYDIVDLYSKRVLHSFSYDRAKFKLNGKEFYLSEAGYTPFYWTKDGGHIYVYAFQGGETVGGIRYFGNAFGAKDGVARFDLDTGEMIEIFPETLHVSGYTFSISPDEKGIIYVNEAEIPLVLRWRDLLTDEEKDLITFDESMLDVGDYAWSPEGDKIVFQNMYVGGGDFLLFNINDGEYKTIVKGYKEAINFDFWGDEDKLYYSNWENKIWVLDLKSKTINFVGMATPKP